MSATLVLIDVQQAMDDSRYGERGQPEAEANMARLLGFWRDNGWPVVHVRDNSLDPDSPYAPGKPTHAFKPEVKPLDHETIVDKQSANAFVGTDLMAVLEEHGSAELVMAGVHLQHCVETTVRMAASLGFLVLVPEDCVVAVAETDASGRRWSADEVHALTLAVLDGNHAKVVTGSALMGGEVTGTLQ